MEQQMVNDILAAISDLSVLIQNTKTEQKETRSEEIKDLAIALAKAQGEFGVADLNKVNPYFKSRYADFTSVVEASRPSLSKHGLAVTQELSNLNDSSLWLVTTLWHISGQWLQSKFRMLPPKNDIQSVSSYNTYVKRMTYSSLIGVLTGEDDDGEQASMPSRDITNKGVALNVKYNPKESSPEAINHEQLEELNYELDGHLDIAEQVLEGLKIQNLCDMPKAKFQISMRRIREIKLLRNAPAQ